MDSLKAAVIGVGHMGQHHARLYDMHPMVELVAIVDRDRQRLQEIGSKYRCRGYMAIKQLLECDEIDIASIATPTVLHFSQAAELIRSGISVLVEKPLAHRAKAAHLLDGIAKEYGVTLAVGHVERCNPVVRAVKAELEEGTLGEIYRISTRRCGPSPERIRDVGVIIDLAVHDLDIMTYLLGEAPLFSRAMAQWRSHAGHEDSVDALLYFPSGAVGVLQCDWLTTAKIRTLSIVGSDGTIEADYIKQEARLSERPNRWSKLTVIREEPLLIEIDEFVKAVFGKGEPAATGGAGALALDLAEDIIDSAKGEENGPDPEPCCD